MYAIYGNIYHQYTPMLAYIPYMDPMGMGPQNGANHDGASHSSLKLLFQEASAEIHI